MSSGPYGPIFKVKTVHTFKCTLIPIYVEFLNAEE